MASVAVGCFFNPAVSLFPQSCLDRNCGDEMRISCSNLSLHLHLLVAPFNSSALYLFNVHERRMILTGPLLERLVSC